MELIVVTAAALLPSISFTGRMWWKMVRRWNKGALGGRRRARSYLLQASEEM